MAKRERGLKKRQSSRTSAKIKWEENEIKGEGQQRGRGRGDKVEGEEG